MFVFEEVHKSFYPYLVIPTFVAALISNYITVSIFGLEPALGFSVTTGGCLWNISRPFSVWAC
nr:hypothetical protein [Veillonella denticariosi]